MRGAVLALEGLMDGRIIVGPTPARVEAGASGHRNQGLTPAGYWSPPLRGGWLIRFIRLIRRGPRDWRPGLDFFRKHEKAERVPLIV